MLPFRKILFPVDYSEPCAAAIPYVKEMAQRFGADVALVHAYGPEAVVLNRLSIESPTLVDEMCACEEGRLRQYALDTFPDEPVACYAELGEPGTVVNRVITHHGADLVMLATHGRGPVRRFLLGSVAAKVLHDVGAAVWTCAGPTLEHRAPRIPYRHVLCAVDESDEAEVVVKAARSIAGHYRAEFSNVHINGSSIADGVREVAIRVRADLIVTGRGRAGESFASVWSNLYQIVRESPCPVLSI